MIKVMTRRSLLRAGTLGLAGTGSYGWGALVERHRITVERTNCPLPRQHAGLDGVTIGVMADFHFDETLEVDFVERCVATMNAQKPDVIILMGDYISEDVSAMPLLCGALKRLSAPLGIYAALGNHDQWHDTVRVTAALQKAGLRVLRNEGLILSKGGADFALAATESVWAGNPDLPRALKGVERDVPVILGAHEPDFFDTAKKDPRVLLQLSGHTHGGQICAPFFGALRLPSYGKKYVSGLYSKQGQHVYVTRGIGTIAIPARFACPPEVTILRLTA